MQPCHTSKSSIPISLVISFLSLVCPTSSTYIHSVSCLFLVFKLGASRISRMENRPGLMEIVGKQTPLEEAKEDLDGVKEKFKSRFFAAVPGGRGFAASIPTQLRH